MTNVYKIIFISVLALNANPALAHNPDTYFPVAIGFWAGLFSIGIAGLLALFGRATIAATLTYIGLGLVALALAALGIIYIFELAANEPFKESFYPSTLIS